MKSRIWVLAFFLVIVFSATANAAMKDRLVPITADNVKMSVDTFIIGTYNRYIATIVRDLDAEALDDLGEPMRAVAALQDNKNLALLEKIAFDKNAKRLSLLERNLVLASDLKTRLSVEPTTDTGMQDAAPGTFAEVLWNTVAGPNGLGRKILGEDPAPVAISKDDKNPVDAKRYAVVFKNQIGGLFLDRDSIKATESGCSAIIVESFDYDGELHFGGMAMQYTYQPYVDASYAVSTYEYSFVQLAHRLLRFTKFSADGKVIYSIKNPNLEWITGETDVELPFALLTLRQNLPEDVAKLMPNDIKWFDEFMRESIEKASKEQKETHNTETAK